jgi:hypothetical protein
MVIQADRKSPAGKEAGLEELLARAACADVVAQFFRFVDSGQATRATELFTEDAEMSSGDVTATGDTIRQMLSLRETDGKRRLHFPTQISFELTSSTEATSQTLLQLFVLNNDDPGGTPQIRAITHVDDVFVRTEGLGWRLRRRRVTILAGSDT